nr:Chain A, PEPTIDE F (EQLLKALEFLLKELLEKL) [unidentified]
EQLLKALEFLLKELLEKL